LVVVPVPNVVGLSESNALAKLRGVDLNPYVERESDSHVHAGAVLSQVPVAGNGVDPDSIIAVTVSTG
jgi:beta-lactam-binding protein with PASTA domain